MALSQISIERMDQLLKLLQMSSLQCLNPRYCSHSSVKKTWRWNSFLHTVLRKVVHWNPWSKFLSAHSKNITDLSRRMLNLIELQTYIFNTTPLVNDRPITLLSDDPRDYSAISPSSLLTLAFHLSTPVGELHHRDELRRDYRFNVALAEKFWHWWMKFYLPLLQRCKKWFKAVTNLQVGRMVLVGGPDEIKKRGRYKLGRIDKVMPQIRRGRSLERRAVIAVPSFNIKFGEVETELIERDVSRIAPLEFAD